VERNSFAFPTWQCQPWADYEIFPLFAVARLNIPYVMSLLGWSRAPMLNEKFNHKLNIL